MKSLIGGGLVLADAVVSGFTISGDITPTVLGVVLISTVIGGFGLATRWADVLVTGSENADDLPK